MIILTSLFDHINTSWWFCRQNTYTNARTNERWYICIISLIKISNIFCTHSRKKKYSSYQRRRRRRKKIRPQRLRQCVCFCRMFITNLSCFFLATLYVNFSHIKLYSYCIERQRAKKMLILAWCQLVCVKLQPAGQLVSSACFFFFSHSIGVD